MQVARWSKPHDVVPLLQAQTTASAEIGGIFLPLMRRLRGAGGAVTKVADGGARGRRNKRDVTQFVVHRGVTRRGQEEVRWPHATFPRRERTLGTNQRCYAEAQSETESTARFLSRNQGLQSAGRHFETDSLARGRLVWPSGCALSSVKQWGKETLASLCTHAPRSPAL